MATKKKTTASGPRRKSTSRKSSSGAEQKETLEASSIPESGFSLDDEAVEEALITGAHRDLLEDYFGEDVYADLRDLAMRSRRAQVRGGPRVLVLPGIMGSKIGKRRGVFDDTIWIDPIEIIGGKLKRLSLDKHDPSIGAIGVVLSVYLMLKLRLRIAGFDAAFHPFDWRKDIAGLGQDLAERIRKETGGGAQAKPIYLVAHSMGGLVSRAAIHNLAGASEADLVTRLIMLGTPNYGSFSPVQALSGYHSLVDKVAALDLKNSGEDLVKDVFSSFPGLCQMLPAPDRYTDFDLYKLDNWPPSGMSPRAQLLQSAPKIHQNMAPNDKRFTLIAGINRETVVGVRREASEFVFTLSMEGDGTVPLAFAQLDGIDTYFIEEEHGSLPNNSTVARAVVDILETGETSRLSRQQPRLRQAQSWDIRASQMSGEVFDGRRGREVQRAELRHLLDGFATPASSTPDTRVVSQGDFELPLSVEPIVVARKRQGRFDINLALGDITQVNSRAIVLGLFKGVRPAGAAVAIDRQLDGAISDFTERRMITGQLGEIFMMPAGRYRAGADIVLFAGLGNYESLNHETLRLVAENVARALIRTRVDEFATVMIGSGSGLPANEVMEQLVHGFIRGVQDTDGKSWLRSLTFCENDPSRFALMHRTVIGLSTSPLFDDTELTLEAYQLPAPPVTLHTDRRPPSGPSPAYLMVRNEPGKPGAGSADGTRPILRASVLTAGSNATVVTDALEIDATALDRHLESIETRLFTPDTLEEFGKTLGEMTLPPLVRDAVRKITDRQLVVINDAWSSRIPWEAINLDGRIPAAESGMSRKYEAENLSVAKWLESRCLETQLTVLLIVNPTEDLPGAEEEGNRIIDILSKDDNVSLTILRREEATFSAIRAALRSGRFDVVHYAGHAFFDPENRANSGIICHGQQVLSGRDLSQLERLPALVFFNACESGRIRSPAVRARGAGTSTRIQTNAGLAESLLRAGVGNYLGTYWPVGDKEAKIFGETFYEAIISGDSLGDAINGGRRKVRNLPSVDWADYILYGSPEFVIKRA